MSDKVQIVFAYTAFNGKKILESAKWGKWISHAICHLDVLAQTCKIEGNIDITAPLVYKGPPSSPRRYYELEEIYKET